MQRRIASFVSFAALAVVTTYACLGSTTLQIGVTFSGRGKLIVRAGSAILEVPFDGGYAYCPRGSDCECTGNTCLITVQNSSDQVLETFISTEAEPGFEAAIDCDRCRKQVTGEYRCVLDTETSYGTTCTAAFGVLVKMTLEPPEGAFIDSPDVISNPLSCGSSCEQAFVTGSTVRLRATLMSGHALVEWTGDCAGLPFQRSTSGGLLELTIDRDMTCGVKTVLAQPLEIEGSATPNVVQSGTTVALDATVSGGIPPYTYDWAMTDAELEQPDDASPDATVVVANTQTFTITVTDAVGASASANVDVTVPVGPPALDVRLCEHADDCSVPTTLAQSGFFVLGVYPSNAGDARSPAAALGVVRYAWTISTGGAEIANLVFSDTEMGAAGPLVDGERFAFCGRTSSCGTLIGQHRFDTAAMYHVELKATLATGETDTEVLELNVTN